MSPLRISLYGGSDAATVAQVIDRVRTAHADGFGTILFPQTPTLDALTALAAAVTAVPDIHVGTAVVPIQGRHPIPLAQQALTLSDAAGPGRVTLGIGVTHAPVSEGWFGIPYRGIVDLAAEELEALAGLLSPEHRADLTGAHLTARITLATTAPTPRLLLAALGPRMLELAGRFTDGTVTWMTGVRTVERDIARGLHAAAHRAGRPDPHVVVGLPVCVTDDVAGARERLGKSMTGTAQLPSYKRMIAAEGVAEPVDIALIGSEDQVQARIDALASAGATELLANVSGTPDEQRRTRSLLAGLARA